MRRDKKNKIYLCQEFFNSYLKITQIKLIGSQEHKLKN